MSSPRRHADTPSTESGNQEGTKTDCHVARGLAPRRNDDAGGFLWRIAAEGDL